MMKHRAVTMVRWILGVAVLTVGGCFATQFILRWTWPQVIVTRPAEGPVVQAFYATGTLLPEREYPIKSNAPGYLTQVFVDKGDRVTQNQPLAVLTEDGAQHRFDQAQADRDLKANLADESASPLLKEFDERLAGATEILEIARREQKRITEALAKAASSQSDFDRALDRVRTLLTEIQSLKSQRAAKKLELNKDLQVADSALKIAQWNIDRQTIRCPIDNAVLLDRPQTVGTRLAVNDRIMQVADVRPQMLVMRAAVDEEDKTKVRLDQLVYMTLYAFEGRIFEGKVQKIYDKADTERRTFEIDVAIAQHNPAFAAGMTAELAFIIDQKPKTLVIPSQAVQAGDVWIVRDGRLAKATVTLGLRSVERTEVLSGLRPDDHVLISPIESMRTAQPVRQQFMDPVEAAGLNKPKKSDNPFRGFN